MGTKHIKYVTQIARVLWVTLVAIGLIVPALRVSALPQPTIAFQRNVTDSNNNNTGNQIWLMNADGSNKRPVTGVGGFAFPAMSPDGTKLAYLGTEGLHILTIATGMSSVLVPGTPSPYPGGPGGFPIFPSWSPDGSQIVYNIFGNTYKVTVADGSVQFVSDQSYRVRWSPNGQWLAFENEVNGATQLFLMRPDGTERTQLTFDAGFHGNAKWSPDSTKLVFECSHPYELCFYDMTTSTSTSVAVLSPGQGIKDPSWTNDPNTILFSGYTSTSGGTYRIHRAQIDGTNVTQLSDAGLGSGFWDDSYPDFRIVEDNTVPQNQAPVLSAISASSAPVLVNTQVTASATFTDANVSDQHTATWDWGDGTVTTCPTNTAACTLTETGGAGTVSATHTYASNGVYEVAVTLSDGNASAQSTFQYFSVYTATPQALFSGARTFRSAAGSYPANPSLTGNVQFGVTAKYQNGTPTGDVNMRFSLANFEFASTSLTILVNANGKATLRGSGTVNGAGNYQLLVTGLDGGPGGNDYIRFQIKNSVDGSVVYDSQPGATDTTSPTSLVQGQIVIH